MGQFDLKLTVPRLIAVGVGMALALAVASFVVAPVENPTHVPILADFGYDVRDQRLIAGDATFVVVASVDRVIRIDGHRTVFGIRVLESLKGRLGSQVNVSQLGYDDGDIVRELEGFSLLAEGKTYVLALVAPSPEEPQDALIVLSAQGDGNAVEVTGTHDPLVHRYRLSIENQLSPYAPGDTGDEDRIANAARWSAER